MTKPNPNKRKARTGISLEEILSYTITTDSGCMEWQRTKTSLGYGVIWFHNKLHYIHRIVTTHTHGEPPVKMYALHACDNPSCVNPDHLRWGTAKENTHDMVNRGRSTRGERNGHAIYTWEIVAKMRQDRLSGMTLSQLGAKYNTSSGHVSVIVNNKSWIV